MKSIKIASLLVFLILFSLSCTLITQSVTGGSSGGPKGFTAEASPHGSVKLSWEAVEGAQSYVIEEQVEGLDFQPIAEFGADQTSYVDFLASQESNLTYRLQAFTDGKPGGYSTASVTTVAVQPNPLTVQATFAEDQVVTQSVGPEGGSLSLTDQNGVIYDLQVPAGAVLEATDFTLPPVTDVQGWPLDGANLGSVRIGPEGLDLYAPLTLIITLPDGFPQDGTIPVGYGFEGSGDEFHIFPAGVAAAGTSSLPNGSGIQAISFVTQTKNSKSTQSVNKAGSQGVGTGSKGKIIDHVDGHPVTQEGVNLDQQLAAQQLVDDEPPALPKLSPSAIRKKSWHIKREMWNIIDQIKNAEKKNKFDCASVTNWYDKTSDLLGQESDLPKSNDTAIEVQRSETTHELIGSLNDAITKFITNGIYECKNSKPGKPPAGRNCLQKFLSKLQNDWDNPITDVNRIVPKGDFKYSDLQDFQKTLKYSCSNPAYILPAGATAKLSPDPICDLTKPFSLEINIAGLDELIKFTPPGTLQLHGTIAGCTVNASGTYTLQVSDGASQVTINPSISEASAVCPDSGITLPVPPLGSLFLNADPSTICEAK
jgi:hypothetical protein